MNRRKKAKVAVALLAPALVLGSAGPAAADPGGTPDPSACHGQAVSVLAREGHNPATLAQNIEEATAKGVSAADVNRMIKELCASGKPVVAAVQKVREAAGIPPPGPSEP